MAKENASPVGCSPKPPVRLSTAPEEEKVISISESTESAIALPNCAHQVSLTVLVMMDFALVLFIEN